MTTKPQLVIGVFRDHAQAEQAINELLQAGFDNRQIRFAGRGISPGGILGKIKTLFVNQDISEGGIYDDLVKMGVPADEARYYQGEFEAGRAVVAVMTNGDAQNAVNILVRHGGYGHDQPTASSAAVQRPLSEEEQRIKLREEELRARRQTTASSADVQRPLGEEEQRIKLREEELRARKQTVGTGEVRVYKDVVAEQRSVDVPVTREEVYVERRPGSGLPSDQPIEAGEAYRIPVYEEQVTIEKQPVEREEVVFGKQAVQETEHVTGTVQKEDVFVERTGDVNIRERDLDRERNITRDKGIEKNRDTRRGRGHGRGRDIDDISDQPHP